MVNYGTLAVNKILPSNFGTSKIVSENCKMIILGKTVLDKILIKLYQHYLAHQFHKACILPGSGTGISGTDIGTGIFGSNPVLDPKKGIN